MVYYRKGTVSRTHNIGKIVIQWIIVVGTLAVTWSIFYDVFHGGTLPVPQQWTDSVGMDSAGTWILLQWIFLGIMLFIALGLGLAAIRAAGG